MLSAPVPSAAMRGSRVAPDEAGGAAIADSSGVFDANQLLLHVTNLGWFTERLDAGALEWPRGSGNRALFVAGLWIGARVGSDTLVTVAEYSTEYTAGPLGPGGAPIDPLEVDPAYRVESIRRCAGASSSRLIGDQTLFAVFNDAVAARHSNPVGHTAPLGVEVRETAFGFHRGGDLERVVFLDFSIHNRGANRLDSAYVAFWCDPDLGSAGDDLVGCDSTLDLGYVYNGDDYDGGDSFTVYGSHTPAVGVGVLQGPIVGADTLGMTSFGRLLKNWNEPMNPGMAYRRMVRGLPDPDRLPPFPCDAGTPFEVSGDPVTHTGCRDTLPADRRFMVSSGPFTMAPGDSQRFVVAIAIGGAPGQGDHLTNLTRLRETIQVARGAWRSRFANVPAAPPCVSEPHVIAAQPNPFELSQRLDFVAGANVERVTVRIHDLSGRRLRQFEVGGLRPGLQSFTWDGRDDDGEPVPAGFYFVRIDDGREGAIARVVRLR